MTTIDGGFLGYETTLMLDVVVVSLVVVVPLLSLSLILHNRIFKMNNQLLAKIAWLLITLMPKLGLIGIFLKLN